MSDHPSRKKLPVFNPNQEADCDAALDSEQAQVEKAAKILVKGGVEVAEKLQVKMGDLARLKALLAASWSLRYENPSQMVRWAILAKKCAERLDAKTFGVARVFDYKSQARAELGNAYRATDQFDRAQAELDQARRFFELGTRSETLEIRLLDVEASLDADCRRFTAACLKLEKIFRYHIRNSDHHLAGRALLTQGLYTSNAGHSKKALRLIEQSMDLIDAHRDPILAYAGMYNKLWVLLDCDCFEKSKRQLFLLRGMEQHAGGRINDLRLQWAEARIDAGLKRYERAEKAFREVREGFGPVNRAYDAALASLDLGAVLLAQQKSAEAEKVVKEAIKIFVALGIERESLGSIVMLRASFEIGVATQAMVEEVARFLRRAENDPNARFEGKAWGGDEP